jgi:hypothetical protein
MIFDDELFKYVYKKVHIGPKVHSGPSDYLENYIIQKKSGGVSEEVIAHVTGNIERRIQKNLEPLFFYVFFMFAA